jgi:ubiquinone/menaquinone biosynthesis C-methylase UbiE
MCKFTEAGKTVTHDMTPEELARELYHDPDYFENNPRGYKGMTGAARHSPWHDRVCREFIKVIRVKEQRLLDVGCGTGVYLRAFRDLGADVFGTELSIHAAGVAAEVIGQDRIQQGSAHELAWVDNMFDIYFTAEAVEHVPYRYHLEMMREAYRVTKPGGLIYIQGQIGFKDYLNPDPNDDAGHIAVFPRGYWHDLLWDVGFECYEAGTDVREERFKRLPMWHQYQWRLLIGDKPA